MAEINNNRSQKIERRSYLWGCVAEFPAMTKEDLINAGFAHEYMFYQLGNQNVRSGPTDNGDKFRLTKRARGRFTLELRIFKNARKPHGGSEAHPDHVDISDILECISRQ